MADSSYDIAQELWYSFHEEVKYRHRYFPSHPVLDRLSENAKGCELTIEPGATYYRARIIDDAALYGTGSESIFHELYAGQRGRFFRGWSITVLENLCSISLPRIMEAEVSTEARYTLYLPTDV